MILKLVMKHGIQSIEIIVFKISHEIISLIKRFFSLIEFIEFIVYLSKIMQIFTRLLLAGLNDTFYLQFYRVLFIMGLQVSYAGLRLVENARSYFAL